MMAFELESPQYWLWVDRNAQEAAYTMLRSVTNRPMFEVLDDNCISRYCDHS